MTHGFSESGHGPEKVPYRLLRKNSVLYQGMTLVVPHMIENTSGCHEWPA